MIQRKKREGLRYGSIGIAGFSAALLLPTAMAAAAATYNITQLSPVEGDDYSTATGLNSTNDVSGYGSNNAVVYVGGSSSPTTITSASVPATANAINDSKTVVGSLTNGSSVTQAYASASPYSGVTLLDNSVFGGSASLGGVANGINSSGEIVGQATYANGDARAFYDSSVSGTMQPVDGSDVNPTEFSSVANGVNSSGIVVGSDGNFSDLGTNHAFLFRSDINSGAPYQIPISDDSTSGAAAINSSGLIVGTSQDSDGDNRAFLYTPLLSSETGGSTTFLAGAGDLAGTLGSDANAINDSGVIVGDANTEDVQTAFVTIGGQMTDLNTLVSSPGFYLEDATGINNNGDIAGYGIVTSGEDTGNVYGFLLTPSAVPEPQAIVPIIMAAGAFLTRRRRR